jgi:hypothetical protein
MEWVIPIQTFETCRVRIGQISNGFKKVLALAYTDGELIFNNLSILLPVLPVKSYDIASGRLVLSLAGCPTVATKLQTLQDTILGAVRNMHVAWFPGERQRTMEELRAGFQTLIDGTNLNLYCPCTQSSMLANEINIYSGGKWVRMKPQAKLFTAGSPLRIAFKIHSLSFHQHSGSTMWTGRFRFQHRILTILDGSSGDEAAKDTIASRPS